METKGILTVSALLALIAGAGLLLVVQCQSGPRFDLKPYHALGEITAEETARLLGKRGSVAVIAEDFGKYNMAWVGVQMNAFSAALKRNGIALSRIEKVTDPQLNEGAGQPFTADVLWRLIQGQPEVAGVVIFAAWPGFSQQDLRRLQQHGKKIVVVSKSAHGYRALLESGVIQMAIVARPESPAESGARPKTAREFFDRDHVVVTAANLADLPH